MARLPRIVLPSIPNRITQRGKRREQTFSEDGDYELYLDLLSDAAARSGVAIWSYCLMANHVHIIAVPRNEDGLRRTFRYVHRPIPASSTPGTAGPVTLRQGRLGRRCGMIEPPPYSSQCDLAATLAT
jgi:REP element-mobilizing transposase RayT